MPKFQTAVNPITDFSKSRLNGWKKNVIVVSNNPSVRACDFLFCSRVFCNWPSQGRWHYSAGYIGFENGARFDRALQTIAGRRVWLFNLSDVSAYWERHIECGRLVSKLDGLGDGDWLAASELIAERALATASFAKGPRALAEKTLGKLIDALGLGDLKDLNAALETVAMEVPLVA